MTKKRILIAIYSLVLFVPYSCFAYNPQTDVLSLWNTTLSSYPQFAPAEQSICAIDDNGESLFASNENMQIIPASVSKLYLEDYVFARLGPEYTYTTHIVRNKTTLYINGADDPFFTDGDLKKIILETNKYTSGNTKITHIIFTHTYFNWSTSIATTTYNLKRFVKNSTLFDKKAKVTFKTNPYTGPGKTYTYTSPPLSILFKQTNIFSTNSSTHALFLQLGGKKAFQKYMRDTYQAGEETVLFETGSGLDGNLTTCRLTVRVIKHLHDFLVAHHIQIEDILVFPAIDGGSMKNRMKNIADKTVLLVKPGFLYNHETLAGILHTTDNGHNRFIYFGIFTAYPNAHDAKSGRMLVDSFVEQLITYFKPIPFNYKLHTYNQDVYTKVKLGK